MKKFLLLLLSVSALAAEPIDQHLYSALQWRMIGPFRGGRTIAVSGVPGRPNLLYMAAVNGGVWKSSDYGRTWNPIFDDQPTGSIGALAVAPSDPNILYVGSGEGRQRPDLSVGDGIYKSTDAGRTWQHLGLRDAQQIAAIIVDPRDANRLFVAALGHPYGPNTERGVYRSIDGGRNFEKVLYKDENTGAIDVAFDPNNPAIIYAALWAARQAPWEVGNSFNGPNSGLFKSTDGGANWRQLKTGLPTPAEGLGRIGIGISPSDPTRIYALIDAQAGGVYRSDDAGETWRHTNGEARLWGRAADLNCVRVDPRNHDVVYLTSTSTYRSDDGGQSFTAIKGAPGGDDYHSIWINPENPDILLIGSDQGATVSVNRGQTWSSWYNQPTAQFYHVITDNRFPYWVYGGQQESGSAGVASRSDYGEISFRDWHPVGVEEYGYVAPDPLDPNIIYGGKATRYDQRTGQVQFIGPEILKKGKYRFVRTMPLLFSPVDPHILYLGSNVIFKTTNGGQSWSEISGDLTRASWEMPASVGIYAPQDPEKGKHRGVVYTIAPSFKDVNLIWAGTDDGLIHVTRDGGRTWSNVSPPALTPWSKVSLMDAGHFDTATAYAAINRFRLDDLRPHIFRTHDGGKSWQEITRGIPENEVCNVVREDPVRKGLLFAGTERGVYVSFNDGDDWRPLRLNLPATAIRDLVVHGDDVVLGTHGRSFWILDDITALRQYTAQTAAADAVLFKPQITFRVRSNQNTDTPLPPEEPAGRNPPDGAIIDYYLKAAASAGVTLEILDRSGTLVRRYSTADQPEATEEELRKELAVPTYWVRAPHILSGAAGPHRFVWDLRYAPPAALAHEYPIAAVYGDTPREPRGPYALPGEYTVRLTAAGQSYSQPLTVKMDPRVQTSAAGLAQQFQLATEVCDMMNQDYAALQEVRAARAQLKAMRANAESIQAFDAQATALEGAPARLRGPAGEENLSRLNGELAGVLTILESGDWAPTTQTAAAVPELKKSFDALMTRWREWKASAAKDGLQFSR